MRWDDLRVFLAVSRLGTLTAAAAELGMNASTVHRRLAALERSLEAQLFEKGPRGYLLTSAGEALLPRAEGVEEAAFAAVRAVQGHDRDASGEVRLTLTQDLIPLLAPHLVVFRERCPRIRIVLAADDRPLDLGRAADVALRPSTSPPEHAVGRRISALAWCRYAPVDVATDELPWMIYAGLGHVRAVRWRRRIHPNVDVAMQVDRVSAMCGLLRCTRGQGLLPCYVGDLDPLLRRVGAPIPDAASELWLLIHADLRRAARVRALVDFLVPRLVAQRALLEGTVPG